MNYLVKWRRNAIGGFQHGEDVAVDIDEAHDIAVRRLYHGGIPGAASIYAEEKKVRDVFKDFDARIGWQEVTA